MPLIKDSIYNDHHRCCLFAINHEKIIVKLMVFCIIIKWSKTRRGFCCFNSFAFLYQLVFIEPITKPIFIREEEKKNANNQNGKPYKILGCILSTCNSSFIRSHYLWEANTNIYSPYKTFLLFVCCLFFASS